MNKPASRKYSICCYLHVNTALLLLFLTVTTSYRCKAIEFWIVPSGYWCTANEKPVINVISGESFTGEKYELKASNIQQLRQYAPNGIDYNLQDSLTTNISNIDSIPAGRFKEGTQVVILHTKNTYVQTNSDSFSAYLLANNLTEVINYRKQYHEDTTNGREYCQQSIKTIFQQGSHLTKNCTQTTSLPLDIVPKKNVLDYKKNKLVKMAFTVYFKGQPLTNSQVKIWHKKKAGDPPRSILLKTDQHGRFKINIETTGEWMISTVKMIQIKSPAQAKWQSYFGSVTWGYQ